MDGVRIVLTASWSRRGWSVMSPPRAAGSAPRSRQHSAAAACSGRGISGAAAAWTARRVRCGDGYGRGAVTLEPGRALDTRARAARLAGDMGRRGHRPGRRPRLLLSLRPVPRAAVLDRAAGTAAAARTHGPPDRLCRPGAAR